MKGNYFAAATLLGFGAAASLLFFFAPDQYPFYPRCLFYVLTGLQCPGCGGLRAAHRLLHGDIAAAFHLNPLLVALLPVVLLLALGWLMNRLSGQDWLRPLRQPFWLWLLLVVVLAFAVGRNLHF